MFRSGLKQKNRNRCTYLYNASLKSVSIAACFQMLSWLFNPAPHHCGLTLLVHSSVNHLMLTFTSDVFLPRTSIDKIL